MTEDVRYLAVFTLDHRPRTAMPDPAAAAAMLAAAIPGFVEREGRSLGTALLNPERPGGGARIRPFLLDGTVPTEAGTAEIRIGHLGVAALVFRRAVEPGALLSVEAGLEPAAVPAIRAAAGASASLVAGGLARPWGDATIDPGRLLWWHRVVTTDRPPESVDPLLVVGRAVEGSAGPIGLVASGCTVLAARHAGRADEVLGGIFAATEEWLMIDELTRGLGTWVRGVDAKDTTLVDTDRQLRRATVDLVARRAMLEERARYLPGVAGGFHRAARVAWGVDRELAVMEERLVQLRRLVEDERAHRQAGRDARRNDLLFVFTLLAVLQTLLVLFDFLTNTNQQVVSVLRLAVGALVVVAGVALLARTLLGARDAGDESLAGVLDEREG